MRRAWILFVTCVALPVGAQDGASRYTFELTKADDAAEVSQLGGRTTFVLTSPSGIGGAKISQRSADWPSQVTLRLRYSTGKGFENLEAVTLRTERLMVVGTARSSGQMPFCYVTERKEDAPGRDCKQPDGRMDVRVNVRDGGLDLDLPPELLQGTRSVSVAWIDSFRT